MAYHPDVPKRIEALLEPGEELVHLSDWGYQEQVWSEVYEQWQLVNRSLTLALTSDGLYNLWFAPPKTTLFGKVKGEWTVTAWASRGYANIYGWEFSKRKNNAGVVEGYVFTMTATGTSGDLQLYTDAATAETFKEYFESAMQRVQAIAATDPKDLTQVVRELRQLVDEGVLTEPEFDRAKELFLGRAPDANQAAERALRSLNELRQSGVLTEAEFAAKKFTLISSN